MSGPYALLGRSHPSKMPLHYWEVFPSLTTVVDQVPPSPDPPTRSGAPRLHPALSQTVAPPTAKTHQAEGDTAHAAITSDTAHAVVTSDTAHAAVTSDTSHAAVTTDTVLLGHHISSPADLPMAREKQPPRDPSRIPKRRSFPAMSATPQRPPRKRKSAMPPSRNRPTLMKYVLMGQIAATHRRLSTLQQQQFCNRTSAELAKASQKLFQQLDRVYIDLDTGAHEYAYSEKQRVNMLCRRLGGVSFQGIGKRFEDVGQQIVTIAQEGHCDFLCVPSPPSA
ncbi:uncharacterized protein LAESUDRAFT_763694 [Laetiporus sulphureus 93-53]|uniref:Uncharacterized protein n=1 Tax=Laetiporus sulphureus 93-53 TaxID=1314785 RepID=A0A165BPS1_9APHY|nr:uncharacterized protein LAESUDRAFT_763694 [Laetiporus sulphureus 93-53]KZT01434.1 hypothetical protein LAESUDRAFT_763694 [Laetiporus sulphureus 93-53]